ncbi:MAG: hypothetical protein NVS1B10_02690 [Candidatus Saccharimonadales bacterium]
MSKMNKLDLQSLKHLAAGYIAKFVRYNLIIFIVFILALYGFLALRIKTLSDTMPTADAVNSQVKAAQVPHIDKDIVTQLESLQDNSVSVKALFDEARSNPFQ